MRKEIKYKLPYRQDGEDKIIEIKIDFISYKTIRNYSDNQGEAIKATTANSQMNIIEEQIAIEKELKKEGYKERIEKLEEDYRECLDIILDFNNNDFFNDRFNLIKHILIDNGYKDNELLMSNKFWDEMVEPSDFANFLESAIEKDTIHDNKKKAKKK